MKIALIKQKMLKWRDFYGQDFAEWDKIEKATTKKELAEVMNNHIHFLEAQNIDALCHAEGFKKVLGLNEV